MRLFGHPLHPLLVAFPIGLLALMPLWDLLAWSGLAPDTAVVAYWSELAGLVAAGLAIVTGLVDFARLAEGPVVGTALRHAGFAIGAISVFGVAFALRDRATAPGMLVLGLDVLGALCLAVAGWFGGHLVFHHGAAVEPDAQRARSK